MRFLTPLLITGAALSGALVAGADCGSSQNPFTSPVQASSGSGGHGGAGGMGGMGGGGAPPCAIDLCPGKDTTCKKRICEGQNCGFSLTPQETPCNENGGAVCDGDGNCVACVKDADCSQMNYTCQDHKCIPQHCTDGKKDADETDVDCGGKDCNGCDNSKQCAVAHDCKSGYCNNNGNSNTCQPCGKTEDCSGLPGTYCKGGACVNQKDNGDGCVEDAECGSGHCPPKDGVCCDNACTNTCVACLSSKTGVATGLCGTVKAGTDPNGQCPAADPSTCGADGTGCNGVPGGEACNLYSAQTKCQSAQCNNGEATQDFNCDGNGKCVNTPSMACTPYQCNAAKTQCLTKCASDSDCIATSWCDANGACQPKIQDGDSCGADDQCQSGHCPAEAKICCDDACDDAADPKFQCMACLEAQTGQANGTCAPVKVQTDPNKDCANVVNGCCNGQTGANSCSSYALGCK